MAGFKQESVDFYNVPIVNINVDANHINLYAKNNRLYTIDDQGTTNLISISGDIAEVDLSNYATTSEVTNISSNLQYQINEITYAIDNPDTFYTTIDCIVGQQTYVIPYNKSINNPHPIASVVTPTINDTIIVANIYDIDTLSCSIILSQPPTTEGYKINCGVYNFDTSVETGADISSKADKIVLTANIEMATFSPTNLSSSIIHYSAYLGKTTITLPDNLLPGIIFTVINTGDYEVEFITSGSAIIISKHGTKLLAEGEVATVTHRINGKWYLIGDLNE